MVKKKIKYTSKILIILVITFSFLFVLSLPKNVFAGVGTNNVTVITNLTVGNTYPEVLNVSIQEGAAAFTLTPNSTTTLTVIAVIRDYNGEADIKSANLTFFDLDSSSYEEGTDNNLNYINSSCDIITDFTSYNGYTDDEYTALANCTLEIWYYANATTWNGTIHINDSYNWQAREYDLIDISPLLALGLPDFIYYGIVNATYVSGENISNITNYGNVMINLSLSGYGFSENDGNAMNCTLGSIKNISIEHEKYNLTIPHLGDLTLSEFQANYTNLTSAPVIRDYNLDFRHDDVVNEAWNHTYWRIYVPVGVGGTCQGNIIFGAVQANGN